MLIVDDPFTSEATRAARNLDRVSRCRKPPSSTHSISCSFTPKSCVSSKALEKIIARATGGQVMINADTVLKTIRLTEKSNKLSSNYGQYTFEVLSFGHQVHCT